MPLQYLIALFIGLPIIEFALLIELHGMVGFTRTLLIVFLTGIAGATLVLRAAGTFVEGMTAGRGFLALSLVLLGRWRPGLIILGTVLLGVAIAIQYHLQGLGLPGVPYHLLLALPYLLTIVVLALVPRDRLGGPAALGKPYRAQR